MKRNIKMFITAFAVCAVSAMAVMFSGCSVKDTLNQLKCKHEYGEVVVIEESTCLEQGKGEKTCSKCNRVKEVKLELKEHTAVFVDVVSPTCIEKGLTDGTVCSVCETTISGFQEIPALGHVVVKDKAVDPTCLESGLSEGSHCSRCDEVLVVQAVVPATGHNPVLLEAVEPTCTSVGKTQGVKCDYCNVTFSAQEAIPALEHKDEDGNFLCDSCGFVLEYIFDNSSVYTERAVSDIETVTGKWFRFYYDTNKRLNMYFVNGFEPIGNKGIGVMVFIEGSVVFKPLIDGVTCSDDVSFEFVINQDGKYVDFFIPKDFVLTNETQDTHYTVQFTNETIFESVSQPGKLFVLEAKN